MTMFDPDMDGIDHINIYSRGKTELGRLLSNFSEAPFTYEPYGRFMSVEGFWYYYFSGCCHDELKNLSGYEAKKVGKKYNNEGHVITDNDKEIILEAIRCKLRQNKNILELLSRCSLPFAHYYVYGTVDKPVVKYLHEYSWIVEEHERIRDLMIKKIVKENLKNRIHE